MRIPDYPLADSVRWAQVDAWFADRLVPADPMLDQALRDNHAAGLPAHDVSATQGKMLALFAQMVGARRILEIGTLGGYSTIWMARALPPDGTVVTIEANPDHATVARANIERAGLGGVVDLRVGKALDILPGLAGRFDLIFIDADKTNNPAYIRLALQLARVGTVVVADNVVRGGAVVDGTSRDPNVTGVRGLVDIIANEPRLEATAIQTVGEKGWDGFVLALVVDPAGVAK